MELQQLLHLNNKSKKHDYEEAIIITIYIIYC